jgi:hypothetical protein
MTSLPLETTGPLNLLDNMYLRIKLNETLIYEGRLRGDGQATHTYPGDNLDFTTAALPLGDYNSGDTSLLSLEIIPDFNHINSADLPDKSIAEVRWRFDAANISPINPDKGYSGLPDTGDIVKMSLYLIALLALIATLILSQQIRKTRKQATDPSVATSGLTRSPFAGNEGNRVTSPRWTEPEVRADCHPPLQKAVAARSPLGKIPARIPKYIRKRRHTHAPSSTQTFKYYS